MAEIEPVQTIITYLAGVNDLFLFELGNKKLVPRINSKVPFKSLIAVQILERTNWKNVKKVPGHDSFEYIRTVFWNVKLISSQIEYHISQMLVIADQKKIFLPFQLTKYCCVCLHQQHPFCDVDKSTGSVDDVSLNQDLHSLWRDDELEKKLPKFDAKQDLVAKKCELTFPKLIMKLQIKPNSPLAMINLF